MYHSTPGLRVINNRRMCGGYRIAHLAIHVYNTTVLRKNGHRVRGDEDSRISDLELRVSGVGITGSYILERGVYGPPKVDIGFIMLKRLWSRVEGLGCGGYRIVHLGEEGEVVHALLEHALAAEPAVEIQRFGFEFGVSGLDLRFKLPGEVLVLESSRFRVLGFEFLGFGSGL